MATTNEIRSAGALARKNRVPLDPTPYDADDPQRVEWVLGWLSQRRDEYESPALLGSLEAVGVTSRLADLDQLSEAQALTMLEWIDAAGDGQEFLVWLSDLPEPMWQSGEITPADSGRGKCRVIEFVLPPRGAMASLSDAAEAAPVASETKDEDSYADDLQTRFDALSVRLARIEKMNRLLIELVDQVAND